MVFEQFRNWIRSHRKAPATLILPSLPTKKDLEGLIHSSFSERPELQQAAHFMLSNWNRTEATRGILYLQNFKFHRLAQIFVSDIITSDALKRAEEPDEWEYSLEEPAGIASRLQLVLEGVSKIEEANPPPRWVYKQLWRKWYGNTEEAKNSQRLAHDISSSAIELQHATIGLKTLRPLFLQVMGHFVPHEEEYGNFTSRLARNLQKIPRFSKARGYCESIARVYPQAQPEVYGALLSLPEDLPRNIDSYLSTIIKHLPEQREITLYLSYIQKAAKRIKLLLATEDKEALGQFFSRTQGDARTVMEDLRSRLEFLSDFAHGRFPGVRIAEIQEIVRRSEKSADIDAIIHGYSAELGEDKEKQDRFNKLVGTMREQLAPSVQRIELVIFADLLYRDLKFKSLRVDERETLNDFIDNIMRTQAIRRKNRNNVMSILQQQLTERTSIPEHVRNVYAEAFPEIFLQPTIVDIGEDNGAWYEYVDQVQQFLKAQDKRTRTRFLARVAGSLARENLRQGKNLAIVGLACGDAWAEIMLAEYLKKRLNPQNKPQLHLFDKNGAMIRRASMRCYLSGYLDHAFPSVLDITTLSYAAHLFLEPAETQLVIAMQGRTYYNLQKAREQVLTRIVEIVESHERYLSRAGCKDLPSVVLIEGDLQKNMDYYRDPGSEHMHWLYLTNRLETQRDAFAVENASTYKPILTPDEKKVEFYFLTTREIIFSDEKNQVVLPKGQLIRVGESATLQPEEIERFREAGFNHRDVEYKGRVMSILTRRA